jgi:hypothetical protein
MSRINRDFEKVRAVILSCDKKKHFPATRKMVKLHRKMYNNTEMYESLKRIFEVKKGDFVWF